jgi:hypothetical protein
MRPGRGAAQHLARKHVSQGGGARYLGDRKPGDYRPGRTASPSRSRRSGSPGYTGSKGLDRIGAAALVLTCARLHPGAAAVLIRLAALIRPCQRSRKANRHRSDGTRARTRTAGAPGIRRRTIQPGQEFMTRS